MKISPRYSFRGVTDISAKFLEKIGVRFLMLDLDNTIAAYGEGALADDITMWAQDMKNSGIELFIVSNSKRKERVESFAQTLASGYIWNAGKPSSRGVLQAMELAGFDAHESALAGDQIFTDTLAANSAEVFSIIVRPIRCKNPLFALRYLFEQPFRMMCQNKRQEVK